MAWTPKDKKKLRLALLDVYRGYSQLQMFVADELGERLATIASESAGLETVAFGLIDWAEAKGRLDDLYEAFLEENPGREIPLTKGGGGGDRSPAPDSRSATINQNNRGSGDNVGGNKTVVNHYYGKEHG